MGQGPEVGLFPEHAAPPSESGARAHMDPQGGAWPTWVARPFWVPRLTGVLWPGCVGHSHGPPRRAAMEEVVIAGMSGKLPESENLQEFWDNLIGGVDMVTDDDRRWKAGMWLRDSLCPRWEVPTPASLLHCVLTTQALA